MSTEKKNTRYTFLIWQASISSPVPWHPSWGKTPRPGTKYDDPAFEPAKKVLFCLQNNPKFMKKYFSTTVEGGLIWPGVGDVRSSVRDIRNALKKSKAPYAYLTVGQPNTPKKRYFPILLTPTPQQIESFENFL